MNKGLFYFNTTKIIAANALFYMLALIAIMVWPNAMNYIALTPAYILQGKYLWTILTSMFMHASVFHLFANMLSLFFLGSLLERIIGRKRFLWMYLASGIIGSLLFIGMAYLFNSGLDVSAVGASGAIFGVAGMLAILTPKMPVYILFIPIAMPMWFGVVLILAVLWIISLPVVANLTGVQILIGNGAHLGGLLAGVTYAIYLKLKYPKRARMISDFFSRH
jgi:membrane associated rhomboid family serine protease